MRAMVLSARHPTASHRLMTNVLQVALTCIVGPEPTPLSPGAISGHAGAVMWPHVSGPRWP